MSLVPPSQQQGHDAEDIGGGDDGGEGGEGQRPARETGGPFTETLEETVHRLTAENADLRARLDEVQSRLDADMRGQDNDVEIHAPPPKVRARPAPPPETVC